MSLEGDLKLPPRGPLKWGWLAMILTKLARAAGLISPDDSVEIAPTATGLAVRADVSSSAFEESTLPWGLTTNANGTVTVKGGDLVVTNVGTYAVGDASLSITNADFIAIRIDLALDAAGLLLTPRFWSGLIEVTISPDPYLVAISTATLEAARSVMPGLRTTGTIYIPVIGLNPRQQFIQTITTPTLSLWHFGFDVL